MLDEFDQYLALQRGRSEHTRRAYLGDLRSLLAFVENRSPGAALAPLTAIVTFQRPACGQRVSHSPRAAWSRPGGSPHARSAGRALVVAPSSATRLALCRLIGLARWHHPDAPR